jgi:hypothetical protein
MSSLTTSFLISRSINCSGGTCFNRVNAGCGVMWFTLTTGCPRAGRNPACPLVPGSPREEVAMRFLATVEHDLGESQDAARKMDVPEHEV